MGTYIKMAAGILFALGLLGSAKLGDLWGGPFFLIFLISEVVFCMCLYALGEIVDKLTEIAENTKVDKHGANRYMQNLNGKEANNKYQEDGILDIPKRNKKEVE